MFLCESMQKYLKGNTFIVSPVVAQKKKIFYTQLQGRRKVLNIWGGRSKGGSLEETLAYMLSPYSKFEFSFHVTLCFPFYRRSFSVLKSLGVS